jgi:energy-coupling factor transporter ATP-binding protein EcfA2
MIEVEHATILCRWITRPHRAIKNVSLTIETGELVTVVWPSPWGFNMIPVAARSITRCCRRLIPATSPAATTTSLANTPPRPTPWSPDEYH